MCQRLDSIIRHLDQDPAARLLLTATLGGYLHPNTLPSPAATPLPVDRQSEAPSSSAPEKALHIEQGEDDTGSIRPWERTTPSNGILAADAQVLSPDTCRQSQQTASPETSVLGPTDITGHLNEDPVVTRDITQLAGSEHGDDQAGGRQPVVDIGGEAGLEGACDNADQDPTTATFDIVRMAENDEGRQTRQDAAPAPSPSPNPSPSPELESPPKPRTKQGKRKPTPHTPEPEPTKRQRTAKSDEIQLQLLEKATRMIKDIVTLDNITFVWERLALLRNSADSQGDVTQDQSHVPPLLHLCRRQHLERLWICVGVNQKTERWARSLRRIGEGTLIGIYNDERERFDEQKRQRSLCPAIPSSGEEGASSLPDPIEEYVDTCFPDSIRHSQDASQDTIDARRSAKKKFENMVQRKKPWSMINRRYDKGVFPLLPKALQENQ
jgi:hypothetical protein